jgi:hypothetical protein
MLAWKVGKALGVVGHPAQQQAFGLGQEAATRGRGVVWNSKVALALEERVMKMKGRDGGSLV